MIEFLLSPKASFITVRGSLRLFIMSNSLRLYREALSTWTAVATPEPSSAVSIRLAEEIRRESQGDEVRHWFVKNVYLSKRAQSRAVS